MINPESWYNKNPDKKYFYQGDVVKDVPFPFWPTVKTEKEQHRWGILRAYKSEGRQLKDILKSLPTVLAIGRSAQDVPDAWSAGGREYVLGTAMKTSVMLLTRSCSLDNPDRKLFVVAPVVAFSSLNPDQQQDGRLADLRANKIPHKFYLPAVEGFAESFVDLFNVANLHRTFFNKEKVAQQVVVRLSSHGTAELQRMLGDHFGSKFGFDNKDICPQSATYACSNCFHLGMGSYPKKFAEGKPFGDCDKCGEEARYVLLPI